MKEWREKIQSTVIFIAIIFFSIDEKALSQNESRKDTLNQDSLRPHVEYTAVETKTPFSSYIKKKIKEINANIEAAKKNEIYETPSFTIQGIVWGGPLAQVIINNRVFKTGDFVENARIEKIDKNGITVLYRNKSVTINSPSFPQTNNIRKNPEGGKDVK